MTVYDKYWWMAHAEQYRAQFARKPAYDIQEDRILDALTDVQADTVLEFGAGFGRISRIVNAALAPRLYVATDLPQQLDGARAYLGADTSIVLAPVDIDEPLDQGPADLVIAVELLMHRSPDMIASDIALLYRASARWVLTADWYGDGRTKLHEGCYQHDYPALFATIGECVEFPVPEARQSVFLTRIGGS